MIVKSLLVDVKIACTLSVNKFQIWMANSGLITLTIRAVLFVSKRGEGEKEVIEQPCPPSQVQITLVLKYR